MKAPQHTLRVAINGAGIAGTTLAYWLGRAGHQVLLLEKAPKLRTGGYVVDFWGAGYDVADKMGLREKLHARGYAMREVRFVGDRGRRSGGFEVDALRDMLRNRFTTIRRSDLAALIYEALPDTVQTRFDDSITFFETRTDAVHLRFERSPPVAVDLLVGADGLHSRVRELMLGSSTSPELSLGYHVAAFEVRGYRPRDELVYVTHSAPGRQISRLALREDLTLFLLVIHDEQLQRPIPRDDVGRKVALRQAFTGTGWESSRILESMDRADDLYFDSVSQIRLPHWTEGRVALVGDAAAAVSLLAGEGCGLAMAESYALAAALQACSTDHRTAFARYESSLRPFVSRKQVAAQRFASSFAPRTWLGIRVRDGATRLLRIPWVARRLVGAQIRDDLQPAEWREDA